MGAPWTGWATNTGDRGCLGGPTGAGGALRTRRRVIPSAGTVKVGLPVRALSEGSRDSLHPRGGSALSYTWGGGGKAVWADRRPRSRCRAASAT